MGVSRSERRRRSGLFVDVFSVNTTLGWTVIDQVPVELALEKVALKQWREIFFEGGELAGVQPLKAAEKKTLHQVLIERLVAVTITLPELKRNAGLYGRSRTIGMTEWQRLQRRARFDPDRILEPEDATELAIEKVRQWPFPQNRIGTDKDGNPVFGDRAIRVYPPAPAK